MKITEIHLHRLATRLAAPLPPRGDVGYSVFHHAGTEDQSLLTVELRTDEGLTGLTAVAWAGPGAMTRLAEHFAPVLLAADPTDVWTTTRELRLACTQDSDADLVNHVEFALWDLLGKQLAQPLHRLLGAAAPAAGVPVYASSLYFEPTDVCLAKARRFVEAGFAGVKVKIGRSPEEDVALVRAVRQAVGPAVTLLVDANRAYDLPGALRLVEGLQGTNVAWLEEPFSYQAHQTAPSSWACSGLDEWGASQYRKLREATSIPIAGGEGFGDLHLLARLVTEGWLDILQPDTGHLGVLSMAAAIEQARRAGATPMCHGCCDAAALVVSLHLQALCGCSAPQEYETYDSPFVQDLFLGQRNWLRNDGTVPVPTGPGLGVEWNPEVQERYRAESRFVRA